MGYYQAILGALLLCVSLFSQDFLLDVEGSGRDYQMPVDTAYRMIFLDDLEMSDSDPAPIFNITLKFPDTLSQSVEYQFICFIHGRHHMPEADDTLTFEAIKTSIMDSLAIEMFEFDNQMLRGIRYINYPGDNLSELYINLDSDSIFYDSYHLRFWAKADTISDWLDFMPLALGNVWKHTGPAPVFTLSRQEVVDAQSNGDSTFFTLAREQQYSEGYGEGIQYDTTVVFSKMSDPYGYQVANSDDYFVSFASSRYNDTYLYEGLFPLRDGSVAWGQTGMGGASLWEYGIGYSLSTGDGFGVISELIGSTVNEVTQGDVGTLVSIDEQPQVVLPESIDLSAYPNPFNSGIAIKYTVPPHQSYALRILDITGREVYSEEIKEGAQQAGVLLWYPDNSIASGVYLIQIHSRRLTENQKVLLVK